MLKIWERVEHPRFAKCKVCHIKYDLYHWDRFPLNVPWTWLKLRLTKMPLAYGWYAACLLLHEARSWHSSFFEGFHSSLSHKDWKNANNTDWGIVIGKSALIGDLLQSSSVLMWSSRPLLLICRDLTIQSWEEAKWRCTRNVGRWFEGPSRAALVMVRNGLYNGQMSCSALGTHTGSGWCRISRQEIADFQRVRVYRAFRVSLSLHCVSGQCSPDKLRIDLVDCSCRLGRKCSWEDSAWHIESAIDRLEVARRSPI